MASMDALKRRAARGRFVVTSLAIRMLIAAAIGVSLVLLHLGSALAVTARHATLVSSEPAADSVMPAGLTWFRFVFSEPITAALSGASLETSDGRTIPLATAGDPNDAHVLMAPVPVLDSGAYKAAWRIVSADGHPVKGSFGFRVGPRIATDTMPKAVAPMSPDSSTAAPDNSAAGPSVGGAPLIPALLRGAGLGTLMALAGLLAYATWLAPSPENRHRPLARSLAIAAPVLLTAHLVAWLINISPTRTLDAGVAMTTLGTALGRIEAARVLLAWLALAALALGRRERFALGLATASLIVSGAIGHPAAISPLVAIPAKVLHLIGVALWIGGLAWIASADKTVPTDFLRGANRVSSIALLSIIVVALSGLIQTVLFLPEIGDILRSAYGLGVLAKVAGLGALVLFGAHHRYRVMPRIRESSDCMRLAHSVKREVAVMAVVILLGGVLAYIPPP
jgi:copper transport protein